VSRLLPDDLAAAAAVHVLVAGYVGPDDRVGSTVALVVDGDTRVVIDPGMVADRRLILDPLGSLGVAPDGVTDVVFSHHHPDHTLNAALFPNARVHDHWAIYRDDRWTSRPADGFRLSPSVVLAATPGHTPQDITTLAGTAEGVVAFTHLWWFAAGPPEDPVATDPGALHFHRERVLAVATRIVPGHGPAFVPDVGTAR
jgi:glyoxylase-like metal-dependent hydrolase (beta-lactamase superfamily II)